MNYLAHLYLSGDDEDLMIGNFMADDVKGSKFNDYPERIKDGILLHRFIDDFTDHHPICSETKVLLRPRYHKLSPILSDLIYDHFLALNWQNYHPKPLREYVNGIYETLERRWDDLTPRMQHMLPFMIKYDWLYNYQFKEGMERVLLGMSKRVRSGGVLKHGWEDIELYNAQFADQFFRFFAELIDAVKDYSQGDT